MTTLASLGSWHSCTTCPGQQLSLHLLLGQSGLWWVKDKTSDCSPSSFLCAEFALCWIDRLINDKGPDLRSLAMDSSVAVLRPLCVQQQELNDSWWKYPQGVQFAACVLAKASRGERLTVLDYWETGTEDCDEMFSVGLLRDRGLDSMSEKRPCRKQKMAI